MNEIHEMQERIAQLESEAQNRIAQLEEETQLLKNKGKVQSLRHRFVLVLAVAGVGLSLLTQKGDTQTTESGTIVCREIKLIDGNRRVVLWLGATKDGEGTVSLYNGGDKKIIGFSGSRETGEGVMSFFDANGVYTAGIGSNDGKGYVYTKK